MKLFRDFFKKLTNSSHYVDFREDTVVGFRKGALSKENYARFIAGKPFMYIGSANDFVILPKPKKGNS